jgi:hypothetical protein
MWLADIGGSSRGIGNVIASIIFVFLILSATTGLIVWGIGRYLDAQKEVHDISSKVFEQAAESVWFKRVVFGGLAEYTPLSYSVDEGSSLGDPVSNLYYRDGQYVRLDSSTSKRVNWTSSFTIAQTPSSVRRLSLWYTGHYTGAAAGGTSTYTPVSGVLLGGTTTVSGSYLNLAAKDGSFWRLRSYASSTTSTSYYPSSYTLLMGTTLSSGSLANLQSNDGIYMTFNSASTLNLDTGTGADGSLTVTGTVYTDDVRSALSATSSAGTNVVYVASTAGFAAGQEVLIIQMEGTGVGNWETKIIQSVGSGALTLTQNLVNTYYVGGGNKAQVIKVPHYTSVTVQSGGVLTAHPWDGSTGGIVFFRAQTTVSVLSGGAIDVSGLGYAGGAGGTGGAAGAGGPGGAGGSAYGGNGGSGGIAPGGGSGGIGGGYPDYDYPGGTGGSGGGYGYSGSTGGAGSAGSGPSGGSAGAGGGNGGSPDMVVLQMGSGGGGGNGGSGGRGGGGGGGGGGGRYSGANGAAGGAGGVGGAGGAGGRGGGIIYISADSIIVNGVIKADGLSGSPGSSGAAGGAGGAGGNGGRAGLGPGGEYSYGPGGGGGGGNGAAGGNGGGGGGGGAGGSIWLRANTLNLGTNLVTAPGGAGGAGGLGGSGGAGGAGGQPGLGIGAQPGSPGSAGPSGANGSSGSAGGVGRIRLDYSTLSGSTNPPPGYTQVGTGQAVNVEFSGSSNLEEWTQLQLTLDSAWTTGSVAVTVQLYNYELGRYAEPGEDGYLNYTSSPTPNTDETKAITITTNPMRFRDGSGNWRVKISGVRAGAPTFQFKADFLEFKPTYPTQRKTDWYCVFNIAEDPSTITEIKVSYWGYYDTASASQTLYIYNFTSSSWVQLGASQTYTTPYTGQWHNRSVTSGFQNYVSSGQVRIRVEGVKTTSLTFDQYADFLNIYVTSAAAAPVEVTQNIYLYNFVEGVWSKISTAIVTSTDRSIGPIEVGEGELYVSPSGEVKVRVVGSSTTLFKAYTDYLHLQVQYEDRSKVTLQILNTSPETVHLVTLYIEDSSGNVARFDESAFDVWLAAGETVKVEVAYNWPIDTLLFKAVSERGSVFSTVAEP